MSSALLVASFAILGTGLAVTSAACGLLWRRVHSTASAGLEGPPSKPVVVPVAGLGSAMSRDDLARRVEELDVRSRALEARLAKVEASTTEAVPSSIASHPGGPKLGRRVDLGISATSAGPTLISVPDLASPPASNSEAAAELDRRFGPVWAMADSGAPVDVIARESGYPIGQVELILGLRRRLLAGEAGLDG